MPAISIVGIPSTVGRWLMIDGSGNVRVGGNDDSEGIDYKDF
jgi:hypothetical protein